jgi:hypothetical protein
MDTLCEVSFFAALILPLIVFAYTSRKLKGLGVMRHLLVAILWSGAPFLSLMFVAWSIFFRDGMGPNSVETHDLKAFSECWIPIVIALVAGTALVGSGLLLARHGKKNSN